MSSHDKGHLIHKCKSLLLLLQVSYNCTLMFHEPQKVSSGWKMGAHAGEWDAHAETVPLGIIRWNRDTHTATVFDADTSSSIIWARHDCVKIPLWRMRLKHSWIKYWNNSTKYLKICHPHSNHPTTVVKAQTKWRKTKVTARSHWIKHIHFLL